MPSQTSRHLRHPRRFFSDKYLASKHLRLHRTTPNKLPPRISCRKTLLRRTWQTFHRKRVAHLPLCIRPRLRMCFPAPIRKVEPLLKIHPLRLRPTTRPTPCLLLRVCIQWLARSLRPRIGTLERSLDLQPCTAPGMGSRNPRRRFFSDRRLCSLPRIQPLRIPRATPNKLHRLISRRNCLPRRTLPPSHRERTTHSRVCLVPRLPMLWVHLVRTFTTRAHPPNSAHLRRHSIPCARLRHIPASIQAHPGPSPSRSQYLYLLVRRPLRRHSIELRTNSLRRPPLASRSRPTPPRARAGGSSAHLTTFALRGRTRPSRRRLVPSLAGSGNGPIRQLTRPRPRESGPSWQTWSKESNVCWALHGEIQQTLGCRWNWCAV